MLTECRATVLECTEREGKYLVLLDRTVIFPEGGGQPSDTGYIGEARVTDAQEKNGEIRHECDRPLEVGAEYLVRFDPERRRDHTEQHTGEHILSGLAAQLFGVKNVGFHMAEDYCTIDFDGFLDEGRLNELEREANLRVRMDLPVTAVNVGPEELEKLTLRKKSDIESDDVRIVFIDEGRVDSCTCCGTHFDSTGKVGYVKITDSQKYKGGTRLWFACGGRAVEFAQELQAGLTAIARGFSTGRSEAYSAVVKQGEELGAAKRELKEKGRLIASLMAEKLGHDGAVVLNEPELGAYDVRLLCEALMNKYRCAAVVFGSAGEGACYSVSRAEGVNVHAGEVCRAVNAAVNGKGGGSASFANGSCRERPAPEVCAMLENYLQKLMEVK